MRHFPDIFFYSACGWKCISKDISYRNILGICLSHCDVMSYMSHHSKTQLFYSIFIFSCMNFDIIIMFHFDVIKYSNLYKMCCIKKDIMCVTEAYIYAYRIQTHIPYIHCNFNNTWLSWKIIFRQKYVVYNI